MSLNNHENSLGDYSLHSLIDSVRSNNNNLQKNVIITDYLIKTQSNVINNFVFNKQFDSDNDWDTEESLIQLYNDMYELLKFFIENQYSKTKDLSDDHVQLRLSTKNIEIYSKTFLLILQEIHKYMPIKPFDIFMILSNIFNEDKIPNVNQQKFKISKKNYESTKLKSICISLMNHMIIAFGDEDKKYQTLFSTILQTIFKHLKKHNQQEPYFLKQLLQFLKNISERYDISRDYCNKFQKYFNEYLLDSNYSDQEIQGLLIDNYFINLIDHKQMNELKLVEDILKKLSSLRFDFKHSSNVSNVVANTLIYYHVKKNNQLTLDNVLEIYSRLITDNLDSRLGLITTFESFQIFCEYMLLAESKTTELNMRDNLFDMLKKFIDLTLPYIEINSVVDYSLFLELFNKTMFEKVISKYLSKNQLLQILNNLMTKGLYIVDRLEALNFTLFYLNLSHQCINILKNDIVDESLIEKIEKRLSNLSRESNIFQIRVNSNIVLKDFFKSVGNETNSKISPLINESFTIVNKSLQLIDVNQFNFPKIHGNALIISNLSSIVIGEQSLILKVLVNLVNFLKNTSNNLIINGKISYYKILISWLVIIGLLNNSDRVTIEILSLQRNQLILLWNSLFLSPSFGMSIENEDELYKFLEIQYHSLTALVNFVTNYHLTETELNQIKKILVKISNVKYNIGGKIVDNLLLQIELKVFMIYKILLQKYSSDFNNNSLLLVLTKNISSVDGFEDQNQNILTEFLKETKAEDTEIVKNEALNKLLNMNDSYSYGLTSLVTYKGIKLNSQDLVSSFHFSDNNENDWNNFLKEMIMTPFISSYYNDHLRILTSHQFLKSKKISTEIVDNSLLLLIDSFKNLNSTIQLSLLQNLHVNLTSKNIIRDRLNAIQINVLIMLHSILVKSKLYEYEEEVHNIILKILNAIEKDASIENYSIALIGETRAILHFNKGYHEDQVSSEYFKKIIDNIVQKLIGEDQNLRKLSLVELGCTIQLNIKHEQNIEDLKDIIKLILDIGFDLENLDVLKWVLISIKDLLKNTNTEFDPEVLDGISNMVLNILLNVSDQRIVNLVIKLWKEFVKFRKPSTDMKDITSMINFIILNEWSSESLITVFEVVEYNFDLFNSEMLVDISLKYIYSNMISVNSNTNNVLNFKRSDMFELTSCSNEYIYKVLNHCTKKVTNNKFFDTYLIALLYFNIKDKTIAQFFKNHFAGPEKLSVLLKVFQMNDNSLYAILGRKTMSHLHRLGLPAQLNKSFEDDASSVLLSFKTIILETILLQIKAADRSMFTQDILNGIIDLSYAICLHYLKDNTVSILTLNILTNTLGYLDKSKEFNKKQTSQLTTIVMLFYKNKFTNIEQMSKLFEFISKVLMCIPEVNDDMRKILNESLDSCTDQSPEILEHILNFENSSISETYKAFETNSNNLTQLKFSNLKVFSIAEMKKLTYEVLKAWIVLIDKSFMKLTDEVSSINVSKIFLLSVSFIKEKLIHQVQHQTDILSIEYLDDNDEDFIKVVLCFINILYTKPEIVDIVKNKDHSDIKLTQVNDESFDFVEFQKMIYCCYAGCLITLNKNINNLEIIKDVLQVLELILSFKNDWNIFVDEGNHVHEELISLFNTILQSTDEFDFVIFEMLKNVSLKMSNDVKFLDMVYDYLGITTLILQKYIPVINLSKKDLYESLTTKDYNFIQDIFEFLVLFITTLKNENMKQDLTLCVLNYLTKVINGVENLNYYFSSIFDPLSTLLSMDSKVSDQFWKITRDKIDVEDVLLEGNYLKIMSVFIKNVPNLNFNIDKFVNRLFINCKNEELINFVFKAFENNTNESAVLNLVYKKGCKELLSLIKNYNTFDTIVLLKFNCLMRDNLNPGSYKLMLIFYSKIMVQIENDENAKQVVKDYMLQLFDNDYNKLNEIVTSYSKEDVDYTFLL